MKCRNRPWKKLHCLAYVELVVAALARVKNNLIRHGYGCLCWIRERGYFSSGRLKDGSHELCILGQLFPVVCVGDVLTVCADVLQGPLFQLNDTVLVCQKQCADHIFTRHVVHQLLHGLFFQACNKQCDVSNITTMQNSLQLHSFISITIVRLNRGAQHRYI